MNLFTRFLSRDNNNTALTDLVSHWDQLEILVITVFKTKQVTAEDRAVYAAVHRWLTDNYPAWEADLVPLWQETLVGGELAPEDPFRRIFRAQHADTFLEDWVAMQNLAAAREALNRLIQLKT